MRDEVVDHRHGPSTDQPTSQAPTMAAAAIFDRSRRPQTIKRDRRLLNAAAGLVEFTANDVADATGRRYWTSAARRLLQTLHTEGHIVRVPKPYERPHVYRWAEQ